MNACLGDWIVLARSIIHWNAANVPGIYSAGGGNTDAFDRSIETEIGEGCEEIDINNLTLKIDIRPRNDLILGYFAWS